MMVPRGEKKEDNAIDRFFRALAKRDDDPEVKIEKAVFTNCKSIGNKLSETAGVGCGMMGWGGPRVEAYDGGGSRYAAVGSVGESLLFNRMDMDVKREETTVVEESKNLVKRLGQVEGKTIQELTDNYSDMSDDLNSPILVVEKLLMVKNNVLKYGLGRQDVPLAGRRDPPLVGGRDGTPSRGGGLCGVCMDAFLIHRIEKAYYMVYKDANFVRRMEVSKLLAVLDKMILKYRSLADDRKIMEQMDDLGDDMSQVIEDYQEVRKKVTQYEKYQELMRNVRRDVMQLELLSLDLDLVKKTSEISDEVIGFMTELEQSVVPERVEELNMRTQKVQARFNYYYKMSKRIKQLMCLPDFEERMMSGEDDNQTEIDSQSSVWLGGNGSEKSGRDRSSSLRVETVKKEAFKRFFG